MIKNIYYDNTIIIYFSSHIISIMNILENWIFLSIFAAITFGLGDFIVVLSEKRKMDTFLLYIMYTIVVGIFSMLFVLGNKNTLMPQIKNFDSYHWGVIFLFSIFYFAAYMTHFKALRIAPNPGYSNALIMFHVIILTLMSYFYLNKPLNIRTVIGIIITMIGSYIIIVNAS